MVNTDGILVVFSFTTFCRYFLLPEMDFRLYLIVLFLALHSQLSWIEYHFSSQHYKILITNVSRYISYEVEGLADLTRPDPDLEVMRRSTIVLAYLSLLASSRVHPYFSIPLSLNIWKSLFSSMYVTACISGHRIIFVWSWKKLIWKKKQTFKTKYLHPNMNLQSNENV